jgi:hypothetical protein
MAKQPYIYSVFRFMCQRGFFDRACPPPRYVSCCAIRLAYCFDFTFHWDSIRKNGATASGANMWKKYCVPYIPAR